jgi:hypothetical protein
MLAIAAVVLAALMPWAHPVLGLHLILDRRVRNMHDADAN